MIRVVHPGSWIRMLTFSHPGSWIQGSKRHPIPDPGSGSATLLFLPKKRRDFCNLHQEKANISYYPVIRGRGLYFGWKRILIPPPLRKQIIFPPKTAWFLQPTPRGSNYKLLIRGRGSIVWSKIPKQKSQIAAPAPVFSIYQKTEKIMVVEEVFENCYNFNF